MKEMDCVERIKDLDDIKKLYKKLYNDMHSSFYKDDSLKELLAKTEVELFRLKELLYNRELEDDIDRETGWANNEKLH